MSEPAASIGREAPFPRRFSAYLAERFPPGPMLTVCTLGTLGAQLVVAASLGKPARLDLGLLLLLAAYFLLLLLLRVLDEFKDWDKDVLAYPQRVLSRGVVSRDEMRRSGWGVACLGLGSAVILGPVSAAGYLVLIAFALLMAREFFIGALLKKDVFLYAALHQPINPLISCWLLGTCAARLGADPRQLLAAPALLYLLAMFALGFGFEVARKVWTPEEERPDLVDSYSAHPIGPRGAGLVSLVLLLGGTAAAAGCARGLSLPLWSLAPLGLGALLFLASVGKFAAAPFPNASKKLQGAVGLGSLLVHLGLIAGLFARLGRPDLVVWVQP